VRRTGNVQKTVAPVYKSQTLNARFVMIISIYQSKINVMLAQMNVVAAYFIRTKMVLSSG
jgi:hypothetical protein